MSGDPINSLNASINKFKEQVCTDPEPLRSLMSQLSHSITRLRLSCRLLPSHIWSPSTLLPAVVTEMAPAVQVALDMVDERSRFYRHAGTEPYKPWIFMISDGYGGDISAVSEVVHQKENDGYLKFFSLGVEGYDSKTLHQLCGEKVLKLNGYDFTGILDWGT